MSSIVSVKSGISEMASIPRLLVLASLALSLVGCAGYRLGPVGGQSSGGRSIEIAPFENKTLEPRVTAALAQAVRKSLSQDGTFRLDTRGEGDIYLTGTVTRFEREGVSYQPNDILSARDFRLLLVMHVVAIDRSSGKTLLDRDVTGRSSLRMREDLPSAQRQAMPLLAEDLAHNLTALLVEGGW